MSLKFGDGGNVFTKLLQTTCPNAGVITRIQLWKTHPQNLGEPIERPNFGPVSDNFRVSLRISPERIDIPNIWEILDQPQPLPRWAKKNLVNFGPQIKKVYWLILTNPRRYFYGDSISAIRGCCALKFLNALQIDQGYLAHTQVGTGSPQKNLIAKI